MRTTRFKAVQIFRLGFLAAGMASLDAGLVRTAKASDHGDTPALIGAGRNDARITDLHAFVHAGRLVLPMCLHPNIPATVSDYQFASDLTLKIHIDNNSPVSFANPADVAAFGGTIVNPANIQQDITFQITFDALGTPNLTTTGLTAAAQSHIQFFAGLRDDPFIRGPQIGKNVAAVVISIPLADVKAGQDTLLIWAMSHIDDLVGPFQEHVGRSLRSQLGPNNGMNTLTPKDHFLVMGVTPDVILYNTAQPAGFPNGRLLTDDVVDLVGVPPILASDAPFPSENDLPFSNFFPFLAQPHSVPGIPTVSEWGLVAMTLVMLTASKLGFGRRSGVKNLA